MDLSLLQSNELEHQKNEIVAEKRFPLPSVGLSTQRYYVLESSETLTLLRNEVGKDVL